MKFALSELGYGYSDLEPYISRDIVQVHYEAHYASYCKNLNSAIEEENILHNEIVDVIKSVSNYSTKVRNNAGGFYNHNLFWNYLSPEKVQLKGQLLDAIKSKFVSVENFWDEIIKSGLSVFGSGWVWLMFDMSWGLKILTTPNQDNPLMDIVNESGAIVFGIDVWEHAYYLQYHSNRAEYLKNIFHIMNWDYINQNFEALSNA